MYTIPKNQGFTDNTLRFYRGRLCIVLRHCRESNITFLDELTAQVMRGYLATLQQRNSSSAYRMPVRIGFNEGE